MARLTEKQLIGQIEALKEIKPRKEWAVLLKSQILAESAEKSPAISAKSAGIWDTISYVFLPKKLAYSFAAILFVFVGLIGFARYTMPGDLLFPVKKITEQSEAALTGQTVLKQNVAALSNRINDLAQVSKAGKKGNLPSAINEIKANASQLAKDLKASPADEQDVKEIAISLKTLADVQGTDLSENPDMKDLYQTVVESQIADLEKTTLTDEQEIILADVKDLYSQEKYADALEEILLISK